MTSTRTYKSYLSTPDEPSLHPTKLKRNHPQGRHPQDDRDAQNRLLSSISTSSGLRIGASSGVREGSIKTIKKESSTSSHHLPRLTSVKGRKAKGEAFSAHDSEYVPFRASNSLHSQARQSPSITVPDDDGSASSSSEDSNDSDSTSSRFPSAPYTYQSTRASSHQYPSCGKASAVPTYLSGGKGRSSSVDLGISSGKLSEMSSSYRTTASSKRRTPSQFTTSSYQPPAPLSSRFPTAEQSLRLPPRISTSISSLSDSTARLSMQDQGGSGYNAFASSRPERLEGTALDAGVHGMKRSWDGFKLEMKFGARRAAKSVERKMLNL